MKTLKLSLTVALAAVLSVAQAAGPLLTTDHPRNPQPLRWDMSKGPVKVYTDIGDFTYKDDGTVFLNNVQADRITAFALKQWSDVATSTWKAVTNPAKFTKFSQVPSIGVDVVDGATAARIYGQYNEGGLYVIYDQYGMVIEEIFGAPKDQVLGIAFAEIAEDRDGDGYPETIVKATAVMNGWIVSTEPADPDNAIPAPDVDGKRIAGVFTHEFGHAINLSHSQVNGQMGYFSSPGWGQDLYPGVPGCVNPVHSWRNPDPSANKLDPKYIETMFPFINPTSLVENGRSSGLEQSTVDRSDDIAAISDLYPTESYARTRGSIAGTLYLKDGRTPYSGINIIARNVADPLGDAISAMTGDKTQGKVGPDGRFRINNLTPGQRYQLYTEEIVAGGYPTAPTALVSEAEYWNVNEQANAAKDNPCKANAITAEAGVTKTANFYFNGYLDGVQYTPVTYGYLGSMSKDGERAAGIMDNVPFVWDAKKGMEYAPPGMLGTNASITRDGRQLIVQTDRTASLPSWTRLPASQSRPIQPASGTPGRAASSISAVSTAIPVLAEVKSGSPAATVGQWMRKPRRPWAQPISTATATAVAKAAGPKRAARAAVRSCPSSGPPTRECVNSACRVSTSARSPGTARMRSQATAGSCLATATSRRRMPGSMKASRSICTRRSGRWTAATQ